MDITILQDFGIKILISRFLDMTILFNEQIFSHWRNVEIKMEINYTIYINEVPIVDNLTEIRSMDLPKQGVFLMEVLPNPEGFSLFFW